MKIKSFKQFLAEHNSTLDGNDENSLNQRLKRIDQEMLALKPRPEGAFNSKQKANAKARRSSLLSKLGQIHYRYKNKDHQE